MSRGPVLPLYYGPGLTEVRQIVIHSVESGMTPGVGWSLMNGWWRNPANKSSVHGISDPADSTYSVPEDQRAWHCGAGNGTSIGWEHAGRAAFSAAEWITPNGVRMLNNSARELAKIGKRHGIPLRWLSVAEVAANAKGYCSHNDMRLARGGTTHTDPGPNFPYKLYMQLLQQWTAGAVVAPTADPNPQPTGPQIGGAEGEDEDMFDLVLDKDGTIWAVDWKGCLRWAPNPQQVTIFRDKKLIREEWAGQQADFIFAGLQTVVNGRLVNSGN